MQIAKKAAIICANGLGDCLLMMVAALALKRQSYAVTIFHKQQRYLSPLFPNDYLWDIYAKEKLLTFDLLVLQNDLGKISLEIISNRKYLPKLIIFFTKEHIAREPSDFLFDPLQSMVQNIAYAMREITSLYNTHNDLLLPQGKHQKYPKRIAIHPTSGNIKKNWLPIQFLLLAKELQHIGYAPVFILSEKERPLWSAFCTIPAIFFESIPLLAAYLYESGFCIGNDSGVGHLASNLQIPTLTIFSNRSLYPLWKPSWCKNESILPYLPLPNFKGIHLRIREWFWPIFVPLHKVISKLHKLTKYP